MSWKTVIMFFRSIAFPYLIDVIVVLLCSKVLSMYKIICSYAEHIMEFFMELVCCSSRTLMTRFNIVLLVLTGNRPYEERLLELRDSVSRCIIFSGLCIGSLVLEMDVERNFGR